MRVQIAKTLVKRAVMGSADCVVDLRDDQVMGYVIQPTYYKKGVEF